MHAAKLASIESAMRSIAATAQEPDKDNFRNFRAHDGVEYCLPPASVAKQSEQVRALLADRKFSARFSSKYVSRLLSAQLAEVLKNDTYDLKAGLAKTFAECSNFNESVDVYLALERVRYRLPNPIQLGDVTIAHGSEEFLAEARSKLSIVSASSLGTEETKSNAESHIRGVLNSELMGQTVIRFTVIAEPDRAMERAREEARFTLSLLRFVSKFVYPLAEDMRFGLKGERTSVNSYGFVASDQRFHTLPHRLGSLLSFELNQQVSARLTEFGLVDFARRRADGRLSPMDQRVERALHWLSTGLVQEEAEMALVTMMISMESLFSRGPGQSIASVVAESTAFLIGNAEGGGRKRVADLVHDFHAKRSSLAHGGSVAVTSSDLVVFTYMVVSAIRAVLERSSEIRDPKGLHAWIDSLKYG